MIQEWFFTLPWDILGALASILSLLLALILNWKLLSNKMSQIGQTMHPQKHHASQLARELIEKILLPIFKRLFLTTLALFSGIFLGGVLSIGIGSAIILLWNLLLGYSPTQKANSITQLWVVGIVAIVIITYITFTTYTSLKEEDELGK